MRGLRSEQFRLLCANVYVAASLVAVSDMRQGMLLSLGAVWLVAALLKK